MSWAVGDTLLGPTVPPVMATQVLPLSATEAVMESLASRVKTPTEAISPPP